MRKVLVIDVGGTNIKVSATGRRGRIKIPSGPELTPRRMVHAVLDATADWKYDVVSIGYPGPVARGRPRDDPKNLGDGWVGFNFRRALGKPVRLVNDAAMQAIGGYRGGRMLFLGLGTGLGSALVVQGALAPLELAHMPYRRGRTYEDYVGERGMKRLGKPSWRKHVAAVCAIFRDALQADYLLLGGGNARHLKQLPEGARLGSNADAITGGFRLWEE